MYLTLSWWRPISYRNQSIDLWSKSMDWFLYDNSLRHESVKCPHSLVSNPESTKMSFSLFQNLLLNSFVKPSLPGDFSFCMLFRQFYKYFSVKSSSESFDLSSEWFETLRWLKKLSVSATVFCLRFLKRVSFKIPLYILKYVFDL